MERYHVNGCEPICLNIYESVVYNFVIHDYTLKWLILQKQILLEKWTVWEE